MRRSPRGPPISGSTGCGHNEKTITPRIPHTEGLFPSSGKIQPGSVSTDCAFASGSGWARRRVKKQHKIPHSLNVHVFDAISMPTSISVPIPTPYSFLNSLSSILLKMLALFLIILVRYQALLPQPGQVINFVHASRIVFGRADVTLLAGLMVALLFGGNRFFQ